MVEKIDALVLRRRKSNKGLATVETVPVRMKGAPFILNGVLARRGVDPRDRDGIVLMPSKRWLAAPSKKTLESFIDRLSEPQYQESLRKIADPLDGLKALERRARMLNARVLVDAAAEELGCGEDTAGFCLQCGEKHYGVEPDAEGYECERCGARAVMGAENIILIGA